MAGCNRMAELAAAAAGEYYYDERDYWWALMETPPDQHHKLWDQNTTIHPSPNISEVILLLSDSFFSLSSCEFENNLYIPKFKILEG